MGLFVGGIINVYTKSITVSKNKFTIKNQISAFHKIINWRRCLVLCLLITNLQSINFSMSKISNPY